MTFYYKYMRQNGGFRRVGNVSKHINFFIISNRAKFILGVKKARNSKIMLKLIRKSNAQRPRRLLLKKY